MLQTSPPRVWLEALAKAFRGHLSRNTSGGLAQAPLEKNRKAPLGVYSPQVNSLSLPPMQGGGTGLRAKVQHLSQNGYPLSLSLSLCASKAARCSAALQRCSAASSSSCVSFSSFSQSLLQRHSPLRPFALSPPLCHPCLLRSSSRHASSRRKVCMRSATWTSGCPGHAGPPRQGLDTKENSLSDVPKLI